MARPGTSTDVRLCFLSGTRSIVHSYFKHENKFYNVREGDLFGRPFFLYKSNSCMADCSTQSQAVDSFRIKPDRLALGFLCLLRTALLCQQNAQIEGAHIA